MKSKQPRPAEREAFLLEELDRANQDLLCKQLRAPESLTVHPCHLLIVFFTAGVQLDARAEDSRVNRRLLSIAEVTSRDMTSFWSDPARARVLIMLQDRVQQVGSLVESCRSALSMVQIGRASCRERVCQYV